MKWFLIAIAGAGIVGLGFISKGSSAGPQDSESRQEWQLVVYAQQKNDLKITGAILYDPSPLTTDSLTH